MRTALVALLLMLAASRAVAEPSLFFLAVGNTHYRQLSPAEHNDPRRREFGDVEGARRSARRMADLLASRGARGALLLSEDDRFITRGDVMQALDRLLGRARRSRAPLVVVYIAGHGLSEGIGWNHFSVPGDFTGPIDFTDLVKLAERAVYAGDLADRLDKAGVPYLVLLDSCYQGDPVAVPPDVLTPQAAESLRAAFVPLRYLNEFHQANPVVYSTAPGTIVATAADPLAPDSVYIGPLARRALLATRDGRPQSLDSFVGALRDPGLDTMTAPAISWAEPSHDRLLLPATQPAPAAYDTIAGSGRPRAPRPERH